MLHKLRVFLGIEQAENALSLAQRSIDDARYVIAHPNASAVNPQSPRVGDQRIITCFAWLPIRTLDGEQCWLQRVRIRQVYITSMRKFGFGSVWTMRWVDGEFVRD